MDYEKVDELVKELISELEKDSLYKEGLHIDRKYPQRYALLYVALKLYDRIYE